MFTRFLQLPCCTEQWSKCCKYCRKAKKDENPPNKGWRDTRQTRGCRGTLSNQACSSTGSFPECFDRSRCCRCSPSRTRSRPRCRSGRCNQEGRCTWPGSKSRLSTLSFSGSKSAVQGWKWSYLKTTSTFHNPRQIGDSLESSAGLI